jgi:hypothetical protein
MVFAWSFSSHAIGTPSPVNMPPLNRIINEFSEILLSQIVSAPRYERKNEAMSDGNSAEISILVM